MARQREINLTGSKLHRTLRNLAAEATPDHRRRQERRDAYDRDFGRCPHGGDPKDCYGRFDHYGDGS